MADQLMIPAHPIAQQFDYEDWKAGKKKIEWIDRLFQLLNDLPDIYTPYKVKLKPVKKGPWSIERHDIPKDSFERLRMVLSGPEVDLDRDTGWGDTTVMKHGDEVWMSDTRAEVIEHIPLMNKMWWLRDTKPSVLISGLGIGLAVKIAQNSGASRIDVVEIDQDVIDLVGPNFADDPRVTIHQGDIFTWKAVRGSKWTLAWHDIWPTIASKNIAEMERIRKRYKDRVQWQGFWKRDGCLALRRHEKQFEDALKRQDWAEVKRLDPMF